MRARNGRHKLRSTGHDRNRGAGRRRRREEQIDLTAPPTRQLNWTAEDWEEAGVKLSPRGTIAEAEARYEGLDGVHPDEAEEALMR